MTSVAILGGGVGGLSAAHELAKRGFTVHVYEARDAFGGKARSIPVPNTGVRGRKPLPGEHGFRFFPGFYRHLNKTMSEIPFYGGTVEENLKQATTMLMAQAGDDNDIVAPAVFPSSFGDLGRLVKFMHDMAVRTGVPPAENVYFFAKILDYLTACDERRLDEFEIESWWTFIGGDDPARSTAYKKFFATGMTRALVAAKSTEMSARTGCAILSQLMLDMVRIDGRVDRVLNGPTSEVWIDPWIDHLRGTYDVEFLGGHAVTEIHYAEGEVTGVTVENEGVRQDVKADYYVAAMPFDKLAPLVDSNADLAKYEPMLAELKTKLTSRWMTGAMYYLDKDVEIVKGHVVFLDSQWALTAISQQQFWKPIVNLKNRGDGRVEGILSVDISDWDSKGSNGKTAMECTEEEILAEVWKQMTAELDGDVLKEENVLLRFLDPGIHFDPHTHVPVSNDEPLLINTKRSWKKRPTAKTKVSNLVVASDFVQTNTDLATMEGANEAARRAVNVILKAEHFPRKQHCEVYGLDEPLFLAPFRMADAVAWAAGKRGPRRAPVRVTEEGDVQLILPF